MIRLTFFVLILLLPQWLLAQDIPDFSANYLVKINGLQAGELKRDLITTTDGVRQFKSETQAKGVFAFFKPDLVEEVSIWQRHGSIIRPQSYLYQRTGGKKEKYLSLKFDWKNQRVHIDDKQHPWQLDIEPNTLDKLIYQLALMSDLADQKSPLTYRIADGGKLKTYKISVLGQETVTTPLGTISTIKMTRHRDSPKGRQTTLWCAPSLHYLPVKLEHIEKGGSVFTAVLRRLGGIVTTDAFVPVKTSHPAMIKP
ncbi:MAG: DUF3108 domain-containing protein [Gammaproteobacteria bacterium]|nr:DUF3108 domain-containing protein [Gammaproteobacteria bacterium]